MGMRYAVVLSSILLVAGCADTTTMRNEKTGKEATCGGELMLPGRSPNTERCAKLMEEAGYKQVGEEH
jgi:hypothetical protein